MFKFILKNKNENNPFFQDSYQKNWKDNGVMREFTQHTFVESGIFDHDGLSDIGFIYYPN